MNEFETVTCSRCGGTGEYSYCQMYGTRCFKCGGAKRVYTKRGAAARAYYENLLSLPACELRPGMKIKESIITLGGQIGGSAWYEIESISQDSLNAPSAEFGARLNIEASHPKHGRMGVGTFERSIHRVAATAEQKQAARAQALAYQDTLTKQGKERKRLPLKSARLSDIPLNHSKGQTQ